QMRGFVGCVIGRAGTPPKAALADGQQALRYVPNGSPRPPRCGGGRKDCAEPVARDTAACTLHLKVGPIRGEFRGLREGRLVVQNARPKGRERTDLARRNGVGSADLERSLETDLRKERVQVHFPVRERGPVDMVPFAPEAPERLPRVGD